MSNLTRKIKQRDKINQTLNCLRTPKSCTQLTKELGLSHVYYTHKLALLEALGYVVKAGMEGRHNLWQALKFDYREEGVDYDDEDKVIPPPNSLADPVYIHNPNRFVQKYQETDALVRENRKYAKINIGISPIYHG